MAALGFGQWILYFMPRYQMTSYDNTLEYEEIASNLLANLLHPRQL